MLLLCDPEDDDADQIKILLRRRNHGHSALRIPTHNPQVASGPDLNEKQAT